MDHGKIDERSLELHKRVADKLLRDPSVRETAIQNIQKWGVSKSPALLEWNRILLRPIHEIVEIMVDPSERATQLRQSSPFAGVLSQEERNAVYEAFRE